MIQKISDDNIITVIGASELPHERWFIYSPHITLLIKSNLHFVATHDYALTSFLSHMCMYNVQSNLDYPNSS
jgi:hypothetical protein